MDHRIVISWVLTKAFMTPAVGVHIYGHTVRHPHTVIAWRHPVESDVHFRFVVINPDWAESTSASLPVRADGGGKSHQVLDLLSIQDVEFSVIFL